jgi:hypothetical protein
VQRTGYHGETQLQTQFGGTKDCTANAQIVKQEEENAKRLDRCAESPLVRFPDVSCIGCLGLLCSLIAVVCGCVCVFSVNLLDFLEFRFEGFGGLQGLEVCTISFCASSSD